MTRRIECSSYLRRPLRCWLPVWYGRLARELAEMEKTDGAC